MILDIWRSFRRLPLWVQIWVGCILMPVNLLPLVFWWQGAFGWSVIAALSVGGMLPNLAIMIAERGLSKAMSLPHVLIWTPLVVLLAQIWAQKGAASQWDVEDGLIAALLVINSISLLFDYVDAYKWWRGDRAIA